MSGHTPGPWTITNCRPDPEHECVIEVSAPAGTHKSVSVIVEVPWANGTLRGEHGATARLIAAAPDLLKVADELVRQVEEFASWDEKDWPAAYAALQEHATAAREALAKLGER